MQKLLFAAAAALAVLAAGVAAAQMGPGAKLGAADANHDGVITRAEFDAARAARFAQLDANHDGSLSADERPHWGPPPGQQPPADHPHDGAHHGMMNPDANGDGVISRAEYDAQGAQMFSRLDANHDGAITQAEIDAMRQAHGGQH